MKFKVGDRVKCMVSNSSLEYGKVYEVSGESSDCQFIKITGDRHVVWSITRFELVKEEISMHKFKVGDVVKVTGSEDDNHRKWNGAEGFNNTWACVMDNFIGKVCKVISIAAYGIALTDCGDYRFPPQALELYTEKVKIQKDKKYQMVNGKYPARVVCTDMLGECPCVVLYKVSNQEMLIRLNEYGEDGSRYKTIEEVPEIDWSKVAVDTPIWIQLSIINPEVYTTRHFAEFKDGHVYFYVDGRTSHTRTVVVGVEKSLAALTNPDEKA